MSGHLPSALGPVMLDLGGTELDAEERELLAHPAVGGVILFSRNFQSPDQLYRLTMAIHEIRDPSLLIAVDQEGGRVQRFRNPLTQLPPAACFGQLHCTAPDCAMRAVERAGWLMAAELRACGLDFSFAPVLDLDRGVSDVIGDRAFAADAETVATLATAWMLGARRGGMASVGKHFPGHGGVAADSHLELPVDLRPLSDIEADDLRPFAVLIEAGLEAVMPAHVLYPAVDSAPAGFSRRWIGEILRGHFGFDGAVFSDDLSMVGAKSAGDIVGRAAAAQAAGCDMLVICNNRKDAVALLDAGLPDLPVASARRLARLSAGTAVAPDLATLRSSSAWSGAADEIAAVADSLSDKESLS